MGPPDLPHSCAPVIKLALAFLLTDWALSRVFKMHLFCLFGNKSDLSVIWPDVYMAVRNGQIH